MKNEAATGKIIRNQDYLDEGYVPRIIYHRDAQIRDLQLCLDPAMRGLRPIHTFIFGPSGSGKTLIARALLKELDERSIKGIYINCWEFQSLYSIIDKIIEDLRILNAEKINTAYKIEKFEKFLNDRPFVLILDNVDRLEPKEIDLILYNLCDLRKIGLVCIGFNMCFLQKLDDRVKSRLNPRLIRCPAFTGRELVSILKERTEFGLKEGTWDNTILTRIARLANGDARLAVQTLRNAANYAENERSNKIRIKDLEKGWIDAKELKINKILNSLTIHHRLIFESVKAKKNVLSGNLWNEYKNACRKKKVNAAPLRTFAYYRDQLTNMGLILSQRALVRGNVRIYSINQSPL